MGRASFLIVPFKPRAIIPLLATSSGAFLNAIIGKKNALQFFQQSDLSRKACPLQNSLNLKGSPTSFLPTSKQDMQEINKNGIRN